MEASAVPRKAPAGVAGPVLPRLLRLSSDAHLIGLVRQRRAGAFEAIYDRHHRAILSFCRHMLGDPQEAEDAVQHTFLAAYNDLISSQKTIHLRPWLYTIARNRCFSVLRARRERPSSEVEELATEGLAVQVQRREDLRDLVLDIGRLPDDQRAALVLAELESHPYSEIADTLGVPREKVKALVFQARESLLADRLARETDCAEIRQQLATGRGGALRRGNLRRHLRTCTGCHAFREQVEHQRRQLALLLPVAPSIALKEKILDGTTATSAAGGPPSGGLVAYSALKGAISKGVLTALVAGAGAAGTVVAVHGLQAGTAAQKSAPNWLLGSGSSATSHGSGELAGDSDTPMGAAGAGAGLLMLGRWTAPGGISVLNPTTVLAFGSGAIHTVAMATGTNRVARGIGGGGPPSGIAIPAPVLLGAGANGGDPVAGSGIGGLLSGLAEAAGGVRSEAEASLADRPESEWAQTPGRGSKGRRALRSRVTAALPNRPAETRTARAAARRVARRLRLAGGRRAIKPRAMPAADHPRRVSITDATQVAQTTPTGGISWREPKLPARLRAKSSR